MILEHDYFNELDNLIWGYKVKLSPLSGVGNIGPWFTIFYQWSSFFVEPKKNKMLQSENLIMLVLVVSTILVLTIPGTISSYKGNINSFSVDRHLMWYNFIQPYKYYQWSLYFIIIKGCNLISLHSTGPSAKVFYGWYKDHLFGTYVSNDNDDGSNAVYLKNDGRYIIYKTKGGVWSVSLAWLLLSFYKTS